VKDLDTYTTRNHNSIFIESDATQRIGALEKMEQGKWKADNGRQFIRMLKDLTLTGYLNSEIGATQFAEYVHVPGEYRGCTELKPGQRVWAV
jgi:hypothetical protein